MALVLTDDELMLVDSLRGLLRRANPIARLRTLRDSGDLARHEAALWRELAEAGFTAPHVPEAEGGLGMGYAAAGIVATELGRTLAPVPNISVGIVAELLIAAGSADQKARWLPALLDGSVIAALALEEGTQHDPETIDAVAIREDGGFRLNGGKAFVVDGGAADLLVVAARADGRIALLLVDPLAEGVTVSALDVVDSRNAAAIRFVDVRLAADAMLDGADETTLARALDVGRVLLAAELLGIAQEAFARTIAYLKEREQFGVKIGSFQALQHRSARAYIAIEMAEGVVLKALRALDERAADMNALASLAKAVATTTAREVLREAVQMHGGMGVTDELDIGLFFKRARVAGETFGDDYYHHDRLAEIAWHV